MTQQATEFVTPPGRIVWGHPGRAQIKKDQKTKQPIMKEGKPVEQWVFGIAFAKHDFEQYVLPWLKYEAGRVYPSGVPQQFSWKYKDGDGVDKQGKPYNAREGWAGHYVLTISTEMFAPSVFKNEGGRYRQMEANEYKTGDWVVVSLMIKANIPQDRTHTPGLYINPKAIEHIGYGQEIVSSGVDPDELFGGKTYQLPPGASATPLAGASNMPSPSQPPGMPMVAAPVPQQPQTYGGYQPQPQQPQPQTLPPPAHDFVQNVTGPTPQAYGGYQPQTQPVAAPVPQQPQTYGGYQPQPQQPQPHGANMPGLPPTGR